MTLGLHFRIDDEPAAVLLAAAEEGDEDLLEEILQDWEEDTELFERSFQSDKAWDPIACTLSPDGPGTDWPASGVIYGARLLLDDNELGLVTYLDPAQVSDVAAYLAGLSSQAFAKAYAAMPEELRNPEYGPDELDYATDNLREVTEFFAAAAAEGRHVVFTVWF